MVCRTDTAREDFLSSLQVILPKVNLAFFSLAGAALRLGDLHSTLLLAALLFCARALAVYGGAMLGCRASGVPVAFRKCVWQTMLTQVRCFSPGYPCLALYQCSNNVYAWLFLVYHLALACCFEPFL